VVNARDAMPQGGQIEVHTSRDREDGPDGAREFTVLEVRDTGQGMDEATRARIFEPFFTTKPAGQGTGLGLSTVYGIVHQVGGDISVTSAPGQGTTFRVRFPRADDAPVALEAAAPEEAEAVGTGEVLLVEDDPAVRSVVMRSLHDAGYSVTVAVDPAEAIALVDAGRSCHLLVSDVVMPGMSGPTLALELRRRLPRLQVLFVSGYSAETELLERVGRLLPKPFTPRMLLAAVREVLEGAPAE